MTQEQLDFMQKAIAEAIKANHPFPQVAAAEAALESDYGSSQLARDGNNLFGMKQHEHPLYGTMTLPTREFIRGAWTVVKDAEWVKYPDWRGCFADRLATLERLSLRRNKVNGQLVFPHYAAALNAKDPQTYVEQVSLTWSTDPNRGRKVLSIYRNFAAAAAAASSPGGKS